MSQLLEKLRNLSPLHWWQFLIDTTDYSAGPRRFEEEEPCHLESMFSGFNYLLDTLESPLTVDFIIELHDKSVAKTKYRYRMSDNTFLTEPFPTGLRDNYAISFGLITSGEEKNCSKEGFFELLQRLAAGDQSFEISEEYLNFKFDHTTVPKKLDEVYLQKAWEKFTSSRCCLQTKKLKQAEVHARIQQIIDTYNANILTAITTAEKIKVIATTIHDFEILHPFPDGNCRTFGVFLLKKLLHKNNLPSAILAHRDRIDAFSVDEICGEIYVGMASFENLSPVAVAGEPVLLYLKENRVIAFLIAQQTLNALPHWQEVNMNERKKATHLVQEFLLQQDPLNATQLTTLMANITQQIKNNIYKKSFYQVDWFCRNKNDYGIYFEDSFNSFFHDHSLSLEKLKSQY